MTKALLLALALTLPATAQISLRCSISPKSLTRTILGKRPAKDIRHWTCSVRNEGEAIAKVSEADIISALIGSKVPALSSSAVRQKYQERQRTGFWLTFARLTGDSANFMAILQSGEWIKIGGDGGTVIALAASQLPRLAEIISRRPPSPERFERVAWQEGQSIGLSAGERGIVSGWSGPYRGPDMIEIELGGAEPPIPPAPTGPAVAPVQDEPLPVHAHARASRCSHVLQVDCVGRFCKGWWTK